MQIKAEEISAIIKEKIKGFDKQVDVKETGSVIQVGDGIAKVYGLDGAMAGEMLEFPGGLYGITLNLEEDNVGAVLMGDDVGIKEGDPVKRTGRIAEVPVGEALIGRVVNAIGQPIDGKGPIKSQYSSGIEVVAPGVNTRQSVREPLQTGMPERHAEKLANLGRQRGVRAAGKQLQLATTHTVVRLPTGLQTGWGGRIRTSEYGIQSPAPYRLATPQSGDNRDNSHLQTANFNRRRQLRRV